MTWMRLFLLFLLPVMLLPSRADEPALNAETLLHSDSRKKLVETWQNKNSFPKNDLVKLLSHENVTVRSAALDILEDLAGSDFDLDPWLEPDKVDSLTREKWAEWADSAAPVRVKKTLTEEELGTIMSSLLSGSPEAQARFCRELLPHKQEAIIWIEKYLASQPDLPERTARILRRTQFQLQLNSLSEENAPLWARQLTEGSRNDIIAALEALRKSGPESLPVISCFLDNKDVLIRETAIDLYITIGKTSAVEYLIPMLQQETDPNILQIAFRRAVDYATPDLIPIIKKHALSEDEDLCVASLQTLLEAQPSYTDKSESSFSPGLLGALFGGSNKTNNKKEPTSYLLTDEELLNLLNDKRWRVREATLRLFEAKYMVPREDSALYNKFLALLEDEDASVRQAAFTVFSLVGRTSASSHLEKLALKQENIFPYALYSLIGMNAELSPPFISALERMGGDEFTLLFSLDKGDKRILQISSPNRTLKQVLQALEKNPSQEVQQILIQAKSKSMWSNPDHFSQVNDYLFDSKITPDEKARLIDDMSFYSYSSSSSQIRALKLEGFPQKNEWSNSDEEQRAAKNKSQIQRFVKFLLESRDKHNTPGYEALSYISLKALIELQHVDTIKLLPSLLPNYTPRQQMRLISDIDFDSGNIMAVFPLFSSLLKKKEEELPSSYQMVEFFDVLLSQVADQPNRKELLDKLIPLLEKNLPTEQSNATNRVWASFMQSIGKNTETTEILLHFINKEDFPAPLKASLCLNYKCLEIWNTLDSPAKERSRGSRVEITKDKLPPLELDSYDFFNEEQKTCFQCLSEYPYKTEDIPSWFLKWSSSPLDANRYNALQVLQFNNNISFVFPEADGSWFAPEKSGGRTIYYYNTPSQNKSVIPPCPEEIAALLEKLENDPHPLVSVQASLARLTAQRTCNQIALEKTLNRLRSIFEENRYEDDSPSAELVSSSIEKMKNLIEYRSERNDYIDGDTKIAYFSPLEKADNSQLTKGEMAAFSIFYKTLPELIYWSNSLISKIETTQTSLLLSFTALLPKTDAIHTLQQTKEDHTPAVLKGSVSPSAHIPVIFFEKTGCDDCARTEMQLNDIKKDFPNLEIRKYLITNKEGMEYNALLCSRFLVKSTDRHIAPSVFTREGALMRDRLRADNLRDMIREASRPIEGLSENDANAWTIIDSDSREQSRDVINMAYENFSLGIVIAGGLADGINPCAFATLIFFLSYLQIARRNPRELLMTGSSFILAVYITYFSIGLIFHELLGKIEGLSHFKKGLDILFIILALIAAILSFRDAVLARKGRISDMSLQLPAFLKDRIKKISRYQTKTRHFVLAAFIAGVAISILELACTGQVYAPIIYKIHQGSYSAVGMLAIYNLAFILPLLIIFGLAYKGMKAQSLINFQQKHTFGVKLTLGLVFLALAGLILWGSF